MDVTVLMVGGGGGKDLSIAFLDRILVFRIDFSFQIVFRTGNMFSRLKLASCGMVFLHAMAGCL